MSRQPDPFMLNCVTCESVLSEDGHCRNTACPYFDPTPDEVYETDGMTEEQVTLFLARHGHTPEDTRRQLERVMSRFSSKLEEVRADERAVEAMINEGGRP